MEQSNSIAELAKALCSAQATMQGAAKDGRNPHFKSTYATLASVITAVRKPLSEHGLSFVQMVSTADNGVVVTTQLMHSTGEWIRESLTMPVEKKSAHGVGSAVTYGRRYGLSSLLGLPEEDDDGNAASQAAPKAQAKPAPKVAKADRKPPTAEMCESFMHLTEDWDKTAIKRALRARGVEIFEDLDIGEADQVLEKLREIRDNGTAVVTP